MSISVAMAVYNGEKYLKEQLDSVIKQLAGGDEIVISYDKSDDNTYDIILDMVSKYKFIRVLDGPCQGVIKNFENAVKNCKNDYIFLCDQDDVWCDDKVIEVLSEFKRTNAILVVHDATVADENLNVIDKSFFRAKNSQKGIIKNIIKNSYIGCCMAFKSELKERTLPFPKTIPMHDQWIGIMAERSGKVRFLEKQLICYRRHGKNATAGTHSGILDMVKYRAGLIIAILKNK